MEEFTITLNKEEFLELRRVVSKATTIHQSRIDKLSPEQVDMRAIQRMKVKRTNLRRLRKKVNKIYQENTMFDYSIKNT